MALKPTKPQKEAGWRIEPPVSEPKVAKHKPPATAVAEPPEEPPGTFFSLRGFKTFPKAEFSLELPIANSSQFNRPMMMAS